MITLQKTVTYLGDIEQSPLSEVTLRFLCPVFDYSRPNADELAALREIVSIENIETSHEIKDTSYSIALPARNLIGKQNNVTSFLIYTFQSLRKDNGDINDLLIKIPVQFIANQTVSIGSSSLEALYLIKNIKMLMDGMFGMRLMAFHHNPNPAELAAFLENNVFLLNKEVYSRILPEFKQLSRLTTDFALFNIIQRLMEVNDVVSVQSFEFNDAVNDSLRVILREAEIENPQPVIEFIKTYFAQLFDFFIIIPEIKSLAVAGTFHVKTPDGSDIARDDLFYYPLSLEYLYQTAPSTDKLQVIRYDWQSNEEPIHDNSVPFSFSDATPVILSSIRGSIRVIVKGIDGSVLWTKEYKPEDPQLKDLFIEVALQRPNRRKPSKRGEVKDGKKLRGQVLELSKQCSLKDLTIIVQAKKDGDELWCVVAATNTDASGNFSMAYPYGEYIEAQAIVSLTPDSPANIPIKAHGNRDETIADDFLYLLVTDPECPKIGAEKDCDCDTPKKAGRLPDHADLINSDEYTQDIGGACLNLSTPNRTLSEYGYTGIVRTSDPDVANYTLVRNLDGSFDLQGGQNKIQRSIVDISNPIRWQDAPEFSKNLSIYQAVTVATGHVLHYKAMFKADGYSLGNLLYSLALAPGQKKQMVVIDSAHSLQGAETQYIAQGESLAANLFNERDITDVLSGNINEALSGRSSASTGGISAGHGVAATMGYVSGTLGVAGGYSSSNASASQNSSRDTSMFFGEKLRQAIMQNAESYRQLNATVVTTVQEGQQYSVTTDVVANHNHCHALTMMYFEVLRHFAIFQELVNVEECIFVPLLMTNFSSETIYKWADVLARHLLPMSSNTYLQPFSFLRYRVKHPLIPAFDAIQRRETHYQLVDFPEGAFSDEPITSVTGYITIRVNIPRPKTIYDRIMSFPIVTKEKIIDNHGGGVMGSFLDIWSGSDTTKLEWQEKQKIIDEHIIVYDNFQSARPADVIEVKKFDRFSKGSDEEYLWTAIASLCGKSTVVEFLEAYFSHKTISQWDATFNDEIAPKVFEALVDRSISIAPFSTIDFTTIGKYHGGEQLMRVNLDGNTSLSRKDISSIHIHYAKMVFYAEKFWPFVTFKVENLNINYTTKHYQGYIINKYLGNDLFDGIPPKDTPMNSDEQRNPKKEDEYLELKLIEHLNSNLEHYNKMLWYNLDPDRRYMLLDGFNIQVYNDFGIPAGSRSLASVVKNQLLAITGNSLVFPVAAGYKVSQSYIAEVNEDGESVNVSLFDHYKPYTPIPPYRISVPSKGVFLEAVQGQCDACERVKENSSQDWTKFTTEEPTPVLPVQTPVPTITDWKAAFKDFAPPLINIQNAPATPAPGAGLSGLTELLGKSGIFKDITGLDATQQNVIRTYLSNQENAKAFAEMAKNMAMQEHNTQHSDKIMDSLQSAKDSGAINQDDYSKLVKDHLQQQIDGGEARNRQDEKESKKLETSPIKSAVELAQTGNKDVSATESDSQGNTKTLEVKSKGGSSPELNYDFMVPGTLTPIKQPTPNACWATVSTMMSNWKNRQSQSVDDYVKSIGAEYVQYITVGISLEKLTDFCNAAGFKMARANTEYPVSFYYDVLLKNGPIWVIDLENADPKLLHGRLLVGIRGDGVSPATQFTLIDPATGSEYEEDLPTFVAKTEAVVKTLEALPDAEVPLLVYYKDTYNKAVVIGKGGSGASAKPKSDQDLVREYAPVNENTLVVNRVEGAVVSNLKNWRWLYKDADGSFSKVSEAKMKADREFDDIVNLGQKKYCGGGYRSPKALNKIVLHETAGFNDYNTIAAFNVIKYPPQNPTTSFKAMPHFCINKDGAIIQFLDVCELAEHGQDISTSSIGIEFVNHPWGADGNSQDGGIKHGNAPFEIPAITRMPSLNNRHQKTELYIPNLVQLESLVTLLNALFAHPELINLGRTWMSVININPAKLATEKLDDLKAYFIINNVRSYIKDAKYVAINGNISSGGWSLNAAGVYYHHLYGGHTDGMIQAFYTWLRIDQKMSAQDAMDTFKAYIASKDNRVNAGGGVALVDVSKIVFGEA